MDQQETRHPPLAGPQGQRTWGEAGCNPRKTTPATYSDTQRVPTESSLMGVATGDALPLTSHQQVGRHTAWLLLPASTEKGKEENSELGPWGGGWDSFESLGQAKCRLRHQALCLLLPKSLNLLAAANTPMNGLPWFRGPVSPPEHPHA